MQLQAASIRPAVPVMSLDVDTRAEFIVKTYLHLFCAIVLFTGIELIIFKAGWAEPLVQALGGPSRQMGILLATGLLIVNPVAGWTAVAALLIRAALTRRFGRAAEAPMYVAAGGFIAGSAVVGFGTGAWRARG